MDTQQGQWRTEGTEVDEGNSKEHGKSGIPKVVATKEETSLSSPGRQPRESDA